MKDELLFVINFNCPFPFYPQGVRVSLLPPSSFFFFPLFNCNCYGLCLLQSDLSFSSLFPGYLPPPIRPTQLAQRLLQQQKYERMADEGGEVQEIEMEVEEPEGGGGGGGGEEGGEKQQQKGREEATKVCLYELCCGECVCATLDMHH